MRGKGRRLVMECGSMQEARDGEAASGMDEARLETQDPVLAAVLVW